MPGAKPAHAGCASGNPEQDGCGPALGRGPAAGALGIDDCGRPWPTLRGRGAARAGRRRPARTRHLPHRGRGRARDPGCRAAGTGCGNGAAGRAGAPARRRRRRDALGDHDQRQPGRAPLLSAARVSPGAGSMPRVDEARRLKPSIPGVGAYGIAIRDELDLRLDLPRRPEPLDLPGQRAEPAGIILP